MSNSLWNARVDLAAAHRLAVIDGLNEGTWNHFSVRVPDTAEHMLVTPAACHWKQVTASSLVVVDATGEKIAGSSDYDRSAYFIHYPMHVAHEQAACVLHVHPPYATALSMVKGGRLHMTDQNALGLYDRIAYYDSWDGFVFELDHGRRLADALGDKRVLFLANHGVVVVGPSVADAYNDLYHLERACMFQCLALSTGGELRPIPPQFARTVPAFLEGGGFNGVSNYKAAYFSAMRRLLDSEQPDYAH
jgi:ribulose-5-phosphate 4-epimerase/fuculose-1-phosphate aldolase